MSGESTSVHDIEQRALRWSMAIGAALSAMAAVWGVAASSRVILFDGVYGLLGMALTWLSILASKLVAGGPTDRYPFGREALAPLVIGGQGLALLGTCAYASVDAILLIVHGGSDVSAGSAIIYATVSGVIVATTWLRLRRLASHSELLTAEVIQWRAATTLSGALFVGFAIAAVLNHGGEHTAGRYVDPILVLLSCALIIPTPVNMIRSTIVELLEGTPDPTIADPVRSAVAALSEEFDLDEPHIRMSKVGPKLYVEVDYLVEGRDWTVAQEDEIRHSLEDRLSHLPYDLWLNVELSGDPEWIA